MAHVRRAIVWKTSRDCYKLAEHWGRILNAQIKIFLPYYVCIKFYI